MRRFLLLVLVFTVMGSAHAFTPVAVLPHQGDSSTLVDESPKDGEYVAPGQQFVKRFVFKVGGVPWKNRFLKRVNPAGTSPGPSLRVNT